MEEERQEEQEQLAMAVQARARCRLGNYLGWLAQDLVSQRLLFSLSCLCSVVFARSHVCFCCKGAPSALVRLFIKNLDREHGIIVTRLWECEQAIASRNV